MSTLPEYKGVLSIKVSNIRHWTDQTFSFECHRPDTFRFRSGEFVMIGLEGNGKPLLRAYSIASPNWQETLEFYSIKVEDGPLTSKLQLLTEGDSIYMRPKPVGTLVHDALLPGKRLILFATGTGIAPFGSIIRDPETYEKFSEVWVTHTCRTGLELAYTKDLLKKFESNSLLKEMTDNKLKHIFTTTREKSELMGRMTQLIDNGTFEHLTGNRLSLEMDRVMICGSLAMLEDHKKICESLGMEEGSNAKQGHYVIEKAFVD